MSMYKGCYLCFLFCLLSYTYFKPPACHLHWRWDILPAFGHMVASAVIEFSEWLGR
uniref:Uncharacterized protein n=1 Tax=Arundo donax TaxID=35708 RepID=A0A0A9HYI4_ARUDO